MVKNLSFGQENRFGLPLGWARGAKKLIFVGWRGPNARPERLDIHQILAPSNPRLNFAQTQNLRDAIDSFVVALAVTPLRDRIMA